MSAPVVNMASAWIDLMAERGKTGRAVSPAAATTCPSASQTTKAPRWRFSTKLPRVCSARMGLACMKRKGPVSVGRDNTGP